MTRFAGDERDRYEAARGAGEPWQARSGRVRPATHTVHIEPVPERSPEEILANAELVLAFAPIHKRAFGVAVGTAAALLVMGLTLFHLLFDPPEPNLELLANYFYGYSVSWRGLFIGTAWAFMVGFVGGWFVAFCRNMVIAVSVFVTRTRAELAQTRDFLDHI